MLRAYAPASDTGAYPGVPVQLLKSTRLAVPAASDSIRQRFGRAISLDRIETSLRLAHCGSMMQLTDLSRETVETDPHLASVLNKRFGAVSCLPYELRPASGFGIDKKKALFYAAVAREQVQNLSNFRKLLKQLAWGLFDGRAADELLWSLINGPTSEYGTVRLAVTGIGWIHPRRLSFGPNRELVVTADRVVSGGTFSAPGVVLDTATPGKFITWQPQLFGEYQEREGLAPRCMYWSFFKRYGQRERMILLELFGKPWRIVEVEEESSASDEDLIAADSAADGLGGSFTARMPRGTKLNVVQPQRSAGQVHKEVIDDCDKQISKLVLGQTGTTDGVPAGLNSEQASVMQDEQLMILTGDAAELSEIIETQLTDQIIVANFGISELPHAPTFVLRSDLPSDRTKEIGRLSDALTAGLEVSLAEAYEISGFRQPERDEAVVRIDQPPTPPLSPVPPPARPVIVWPIGTSPAAGEQQPVTPQASVEEGAREGAGVSVGSADQASILTVNEAREGQNLPLLTMPDGSLDPDGELTVAEYKAKHGTKQTEESESESESAEPTIDIKAKPLAMLEARADLMIRKKGGEWCVYSEDGSRGFGCYPTPEKAVERLRQIEAFKHMELADVLARGDLAELELRSVSSPNAGVQLARQPSTVNGSPEMMIDRGIEECQPIFDSWAKSVVDAVAGQEDARAIAGRADHAVDRLSVDSFVAVLEHTLVHSAALGALDSWFEEQTDEVVAPVKFANVGESDLTTPEFAAMKFEPAMKTFAEKKVVSKSAFEKLTSVAKRKAFTVAGLSKQHLRNLTHSELARQIGQGASLRDFAPAFSARLESAGFVAVSEKVKAAYVENVFRTNVLGAYNAGRYERQTQPEVVKMRPYWQIRTITDNRRRKTHGRADRLVLRADDPFWQRAYTPFGWECRCRIVTLSKKQAEGLTITDGASIDYLPDPGFVSGTSALMTALWPREPMVLLDLNSGLMTASYEVQTLVFDKKKFPTRKAAIAWAKSHGFEGTTSRETSGTWRIRQRPPSDFVQKTFRTKEIADGVSIVEGETAH